METVQVHPAYRRLGSARRLVQTVCAEAVAKGCRHFSMYARTLNGFSDFLARMFAGSVRKREWREGWHWCGGESCEYLEWECP
jgi:GNAT superfamily N-acetyltransferase